MIKAILVGIVVMLLTVLMDRSFRGEDFYKKVDGEDNEIARVNWAGFDDPVTWTRAIGYGAITGIVVFFTGVTVAGHWWLVPLLCLIAMIGLMFQYAWWWGFAEPSSIKSLIWLLIIEYVLYLVARGSAAALSGALAAKGWKTLAGLSKVLPPVIRILCSWSAIVGLARRSDKKVLATILKWLAILLILIWLISSLANTGIDFGLSKAQVAGNTAEATATPEPTATSTPAPTAAPQLTTNPGYGEIPTDGSNWYTFYNLFMQQDNDPSNDHNFGPNPYREKWTVNDYYNDFCARLRKDPVLGAADMAYFDLMTGTQISGVIYRGDRAKWLDDINRRAEEFASNHDLYERTLTEFFKVLSTTEVKIKWYTDIKNLMFMDPCGRRSNRNYKGAFPGMPLVIVEDTNEREAYFLVFEYKKDNWGGVVEVGYKIDCGYQPRNIPGDGGTGPGTGGGGGGTVPPPHPPGLDKDPTKGTDVGGNDTSGPGPNTNNGVGVHNSTEDQPTNSGSMTYPEYRDEVTDLTETADGQRVGGDPNTPTVQTPSGANVDNNANTGTGNGGIDTPTTVEGYVQTDGGVAVGGQTETRIEMPD